MTKSGRAVLKSAGCLGGLLVKRSGMDDGTLDALNDRVQAMWAEIRKG